MIQPKQPQPHHPDAFPSHKTAGLLTTHKLAEVVNPDSTIPVLITVEHASPAIPEEIHMGTLPNAETLPYFYDVGAPDVARHLAERFGATTIFGRYSRLVVDLNRMEGQDDLIAENEYWGIPLPGNMGLSEADKEKRIHDYYHPYHATIAAHLERLRRLHETPLFFSIHSYPRHELTVEQPYPWDFACLYNKDNRMARIFMDHIQQAYPDICVGDNQPYDLREYQTGSILKHGEANDMPYLVIEICIDRMQTENDIAFWSHLLQECLEKSISDLLPQS